MFLERLATNDVQKPNSNQSIQRHNMEVDHIKLNKRYEDL